MARRKRACFVPEPGLPVYSTYGGSSFGPLYPPYAARHVGLTVGPHSRDAALPIGGPMVLGSGAATLNAWLAAPAGAAPDSRAISCVDAPVPHDSRGIASHTPAADHRGRGKVTHALFGSHSPFPEKKSVSQIFFQKWEPVSKTGAVQCGHAPAPKNPGPTRSLNCLLPGTPVQPGLTIQEPETGTGDRDRPREGQELSETSTGKRLITRKNSESQSLDHTNKDMGNHYLGDVHQDFTLHSAQEDRIF